jgi:anti-sigma factor (TIGR02949 family)
MSGHNCLEALLKLYPLLDGELGEAEALEIQRHFELCPPCKPALVYVRSFRNALHRAAADQQVAPAPLKHRLQERLRAE